MTITDSPFYVKKETQWGEKDILGWKLDFGVRSLFILFMCACSALFLGFGMPFLGELVTQSPMSSFSAKAGIKSVSNFAHLPLEAPNYPVTGIGKAQSKEPQKAKKQRKNKSKSTSNSKKKKKTKSIQEKGHVTRGLHRRQVQQTRVDAPIPYPKDAQCWRTQIGHGSTVMGFIDALAPMRYAYYNVTFPVEPGNCYRFACSVNSFAAGYFCNKHTKRLDVAFAAAATVGMTFLDAIIMGQPWIPEGHLCGVEGEEAQTLSRIYRGVVDYANYTSPFEIRLKNSNCSVDEQWQEPL